MSTKLATVTDISTASSKRKKAKKSAKKAPVDTETLILEHRENGRKLARSILRRWRARMNAEEIDSIVDITLCEAAERFDQNNGAAFMTFYFYHLRGFLVRSVAERANSTTLLAFGSSNDAESFLNEGVGENSSGATGDLEHPSQHNECPETLLLRKENIEVCRDACDGLDDLEKEVIFRSFGDEEALVDIAKSLGYSRCHISRVKKRAMEQIGKNISQETDIIHDEDVTPGFAARMASANRRSQSRRSRRRTITLSRNDIRDALNQDDDEMTGTND